MEFRPKFEFNPNEYEAPVEEPEIPAVPIRELPVKEERRIGPAEPEVMIVARRELQTAARELHESGKTFPFPGITGAAYMELKESEDELAHFATPIDTLVRKFIDKGMSVVSHNGNAFIIPAHNEDLDDAVENDSLFPHQLQTTPAMDPKLKRLILLGKILHQKPEEKAPHSA